MAMPRHVPIVDLMIGFPKTGSRRQYHFLRPVLREESRDAEFPVEYMFNQVPDHLAESQDPVAATVEQMDRVGIAVGLIMLGSQEAERALSQHPDRFAACVQVDPNDIGATVRAVRQAHARHGVKAVSTFPAGHNPQVPVSDPRHYPLYQTCVELDLPVIVNAGIAGPRVPSACQGVAHFDEVCYDFPDLRIVMRHGAEPWEDLAVKLMVKWPGLFYMTSAFAPRYYPKAVIEFANTRGAQKVMYAGYYPMGLSMERIFSELPRVPLRQEVWPLFLGANAARVFNLELPAPVMPSAPAPGTGGS